MKRYYVVDWSSDRILGEALTRKQASKRTHKRPLLRTFRIDQAEFDRRTAWVYGTVEDIDMARKKAVAAGDYSLAVYE